VLGSVENCGSNATLIIDDGSERREASV